MVPAGRELADPWISKLLFIYIDPVVALANKVVHLKAEQLPALLDVDRASYLTKIASSVRFIFLCGLTLTNLSR